MPEDPKQQLIELIELAPQILVSNPADGKCAAKDCQNEATRSTLIGLRLCDLHFSEFYSDSAGPTLEDGALALSSIEGQE